MTKRPHIIDIKTLGQGTRLKIRDITFNKETVNTVTVDFGTFGSMVSVDDKPIDGPVDVYYDGVMIHTQRE